VVGRYSLSTGFLNLEAAGARPVGIAGMAGVRLVKLMTLLNKVVLDRYANCDGVFVLVCSGSLEANSVKKLIKIVYNLLIEPIQLSSFVVRELGVSPVRLKYASSEG